jgi:hypothetical protein
MTAIITDNLKIENCSNFIESISASESSSSECFYTFIGYPNPTTNWVSWDSNVQNPIDNFNYSDSYKESILGVKKLTSSEVIRAIPKVQWVTGIKYDMYRHDYSPYKLTPNSGTTRLYDSNFYVVNSQFRVYICIYNGSGYANPSGVPSTIEPTHTDPSEYIDRGDGYIWKYVYSISPSDYLKFDSTNYIPVPNNWNTSNSSDIVAVRDSAVSGSIRAIVVERSGKYLVGTNPQLGVSCNIRGDGTGGIALVKFDSEGNVTSAEVTSPGSGYTYATLDLDSVVALDSSSEKAIFTVIIPPQGGHGFDLYKELGAFRCLVYSRIENLSTNPDFIVGNQFCRVGISKNIRAFGSSSLFTSSTGSGVHGIAINATGLSITDDSIIRQSSTGAIGNIVSSEEIGSVTIIKYIQPRDNYVDTYSSPSQGILKTFDPFILNPDFTGLSTSSSYTYSPFNNTSVTIGISSTTYNVVDIGSGSTVDQYQGVYLGQSFTNGLSNPDINIKSGDILYVDNRSTITRQSNQREDIKIIIEF